MSEHNDWDIDQRTNDFYVNSELHGYDRDSNSGAGGGFFETTLSILGMFSGLIIQSIIYVILGIDVSDVPVIVIIILWILFSSLTGVLFGHFAKK